MDGFIPDKEEVISLGAFHFVSPEGHEIFTHDCFNNEGEEVSIGDTNRLFGNRRIVLIEKGQEEYQYTLYHNTGEPLRTEEERNKVTLNEPGVHNASLLYEKQFFEISLQVPQRSRGVGIKKTLRDGLITYWHE